MRRGRCPGIGIESSASSAAVAMNIRERLVTGALPREMTESPDGGTDPVAKLSPAWKWLAIAAILGTGFVHAHEARDAFGDAKYKGLLFVGNGIGALVAAVGIYRNQRALGWLLGLLVAGGALLAYVASRTIGLPGLPAEPDAWLEPMGVVSMTCEALFVILFAITLKGRSITP